MIPVSLEFSKQEYWSGLPVPPPGDLPNPSEGGNRTGSILKAVLHLGPDCGL